MAHEVSNSYLVKLTNTGRIGTSEPLLNFYASFDPCPLRESVDFGGDVDVVDPMTLTRHPLKTEDTKMNFDPSKNSTGFVLVCFFAYFHFITIIIPSRETTNN